METAVKYRIDAVKSDCNEVECLVFRGGDFDVRNDEVFKRLAKGLDRLEVFREIEDGINGLVDGGMESDRKKVIGDLVRFEIQEYWKGFDEDVMAVILIGIDGGVTERVAERPKIYNFLEEEVLPEEIKDVLEMGKKFVPFVHENGWDVQERCKKSILEYLVRYRRYVEGGSEINSNELYKWIEGAIDEAVIWGTESCHTEFYKRVCRESKEVLRVAYNRKRGRSEDWRGGLSMNDIEKKMMEIDGVIVENDKNHGWSLMPCEAMKIAEKEMMVTMGGVIVDRDVEVVVGDIDQRVMEFEGRLSSDQLDVLNRYSLRRRIQRGEVVMPFLRLKLKVHKISSKNMDEKVFGSFRYRPIQDSTFCSLSIYNRIMMEMARELGGKLKKVEPKMMKIDSKSGVEFAQRIRSLNINCERGLLLLSGDFSDAYSNCDLSDVNRAIVVIGRFVGLNEGRIRLMIELAWLILSNNYISCTEDIYLLGTVLPMGNSCSGDLLDLVCYASEMKLYSSCLQLEDVRVEIVGGKVWSIETGPVVEGEQRLTIVEEKAVREYSRYRDDTQGIIEVEEVETMKKILWKLGTIYPKKLVYNISICSQLSSHLDVCFLVMGGIGGLKLFPRKSIDSPVGFGPALSNMSEEHRSNFILGEHTRYGRISDDEKIVEKFMKMLYREMASVGYDQRYLQDRLKNMLVRKQSKDDGYEVEHLGVVCQYDGVDHTHQLLRHLLRGGGVDYQVRVDNIMPVPGMKLRGYLMSRRKYLQKMKN